MALLVPPITLARRNTLDQTGLTPFSGADGDGDGSILAADYDVWKANYGEMGRRCGRRRYVARVGRARARRPCAGNLWFFVMIFAHCGYLSSASDLNTREHSHSDGEGSSAAHGQRQDHANARGAAASASADVRVDQIRMLCQAGPSPTAAAKSRRPASG